jgi:hypothetical protein
MITLKADDRSRVKLPGIKPGQVFAFEDQGNGVRVLTEVKKAVREAFPRGSLLKYVDEWNKEFAPIVKKMKVPPPPKDWD